MAYDPSAVDAALAKRGAVAGADGAWTWTLKHGAVEVRPLREAGEVRATELRIPLSDKLDLVRELVVEASSVAEEARVKLYDPQLSRTIGPKDDGLVAEQYFATAKYAGEMVGLSEAVGASFAPPREGLKPGTKVLIGIIGGLIALYLLVERLLQP